MAHKQYIYIARDKEGRELVYSTNFQWFLKFCQKTTTVYSFDCYKLNSNELAYPTGLQFLGLRKFLELRRNEKK